MAAPGATNHYRMRLNNHLQSDGGTQRLEWSNPIKVGPDHEPSWTIVASLDGAEAGRATKRDLSEAKEEAARQVLRRLLVPNVVTRRGP